MIRKKKNANLTNLTNLIIWRGAYMLLIIEIVGLILISSTLSSAESFAYLLFGYIFLKIACSWLKGKMIKSKHKYDVCWKKSLVCVAVE